MKKILLIDDNEDNLLSLKALISDLFSGVGIYTATSGPEGIGLAKTHLPDVILLDILMPVMDGFEVCKIIREDESLSDIPVVFVTALKEKSASKVRALEVGAEGFLSKPVDENELVAHINAMLKIKEASDSKKSEKQRLEKMVSERTKKLEEELRLNREMSKKLGESEERFRVAQEMSPDGFTILHPVRNEKGEVFDFTWVYENQAIASINVTDPKDVIGKRLLDLFPSHRGTVVFDTYLNVANTGKTLIIEEVYVGEITSRPTWLRLVVVSMGEDIAILTQDITQRKRAEETLRLSEEKYRSIFDNAVEGIFQTTPEGRFLSINPSFAKLAGYESPEEMMKCITDLGHQLYVNPEDRKQFKKLIKEHGLIEGYEVQQYRKDGSTIWVLINARCVYDEHGVLMYYEGTFEDITPRKLAEESLQQTLEKLRKSLAGTIQAMSLTVETRDPYTAGHQRRVANLARSIAQEMGLSNDTVDNIRMAGNIHDVGKISIPAEILVKPTKLTDIEMSLIRVHSQSGYDILKDVELPYPIAEIVLQHHERIDGSGYPQGLKGNEIHLESKILAVADVTEAIATHRPYRPALGIDVALAEIEKNKGVLYDEKVVKVCLKLFREKGFTFEST